MCEMHSGALTGVTEIEPVFILRPLCLNSGAVLKNDCS